MALIRGLGWLLLALVVATIVNDGLAWWSEGAFHLLALGDIWSRLDFGSLAGTQAAVQRHLSQALWTWGLAPLLKIPALPVFLVLGIVCLVFAGRDGGGGRGEAGFVGSRAPRRRRGRNSLA